ncbi:hypothetical protein vseg_006258 [Gypsophila vaccaria]
MNDVLPFSTQLSARKLASFVWEFHHIFNNNNNNNNNTMYMGVDDRRRLDKHEGFDQIHQRQRSGNLEFDHHPANAGSTRRHSADSFVQHRQSTERNKHRLQPLSPASYGSSFEMAVESRRQIGESSHRFKTSAELLKVLNRIWSLEEQHASNMTLVKGLKTELDHARARIKQLLREQRANRHEIDQLVKRISEDSLARKGKDHDQIDATLQSARKEMEDERKLRKRSESLHRKLARELFEVKVALATSVKESEKEKKSSAILEELCDEFAKGIREFAREVHAAKQKPDKDWTGVTDRESLILHMSESWLDERTQIKDRGTQGIIAQRQPATDKLRYEIKTFLATRQAVDVKTPLRPEEPHLRRCSLESIPEAVTAPQNSAFSDLHGAEMSKAGPSRYGEQEELALRKRRKGQSPPSVQMFDPQNTPYEVDHGITKASEGTSTEINMLKKSDIYDSVKEQRKKAYNEEGHGSNSKTVDKLMSELLLSEGGSVPPEYEYKEVASTTSKIRRYASPTRQWMASMASPDRRTPETSSKTLSVKDNTLKAKLQEPKSKGQRSRLKIMEGSS